MAVFAPLQPVSTRESEPLSSCLNEAQSKEKKWIEHALTLVEKDDLTSDDALVWVAFHALQQPITEDPSCSVCTAASFMKSPLHLQ